MPLCLECFAENPNAMIVFFFRGDSVNCRAIVSVMLLLAIAFGTGGCLVAAVGAGAAGTAVYLTGDLEAMEPHGIDAVYAAARKAVGDLELSLIESETGKDALAATVTARDSEGKDIKIKLASTTTGTTKMSIRIGVFGDKTKSTLILQQIQENLKNF